MSQLKLIKEKWNPIYNQLKELHLKLTSLEEIIKTNSVSVK